jgi:lysozyme
VEGVGPVTERIIDVSNYQGHVDWAAVKASGVAGAICKATEGPEWIDPTFHDNWGGIGAQGLKRGAYHFARPGDANLQAAHFASVVGSVNPWDVLVLDLETRVGSEDAWAIAFLTALRRLTGVQPWLYSYEGFLHTYLSNPALGEFPLWIAAYQASPPPCPSPWKSYALWQHSDSALVGGVNGKVDESLGTLPGPTLSAEAIGGLDVSQVVDAMPSPNGGVWVAARDGGVFAYHGAPFHGSYPGLPPEDRQGNRNCTNISPRDDGIADGYMLVFDDGSKYRFP